MWQLRQRWQREQTDEIRHTERVRLESFRVRRLLILLVMLGFGIDAGLLAARFVEPFSYTAIAVSVIGGLALALLLLAMPRQAVRVLHRAWIASGLFFKRRRLRRLVNAERAAITNAAQDVLSPSVIADLAVTEYLRGSPETAEVDLSRAPEFATDAPCLANNLGVVLADQGQHERAAELFARPAPDCADEMALNCALLAPLLASPRRLEELTTFNGQPNATAFNNIGVSYARHDDWEAGAHWFARAIDAVPNLPAARANLGLVAYRHGQLQEAADNIMLANRQEPNEPAFANYLGVILAAAGQTDQARFYFRRAYRVDPASLAIRLNMSAAEALGGHWQVAQKGFRTLLGSQERTADIHYNLAVTDLAVQDATSAAANASTAIALGDISSDAYTVLAVALWETGRRAEALSHFATANEAPGAGAVAASNLGRALLLEGQPDRALAVLEAARAKWPEDVHLELDIATAILAQGAANYSDALRPEQRQPILDRVQRAYASLENTIEREGEGTAEARVNMGMYLYMQEQYEAAAEHLEVAARLEPKLKELQYLIGTTLGREGEKQTLRTEDGDSAPTASGRSFLRRAVPSLEAGLEAREVLVPASYNLARCLYVLKDYERALAAVRKGLRLESNEELNTLAALAAARQAQRVRLLYKTQMLSDNKRDQLRARTLELLNVAVHYFRQALLRNELDPTSHGNLGIAYMLRNRKQDVEAALRHWERMRAIGGGAGQRRYEKLAQMENLADPSRVGFDDRNAKLRGLDVLRWLAVAPPRPPGIRFVIEPVAVQLPWRLVTASERLKQALLLRDRIAQDELRLARLRV